MTRRRAGEALCIAVLLLATALIAVGALAMMGVGTVRLLDAALVACLVPAGVTFVVVVVSTAMRHGRSERPSLPRRYAAAGAAVFAVGVVAAGVGFAREAHSGKTTTCGAGYCRYGDGQLVPITSTAYLEDQGSGALFGGAWSAGVMTIALAGLRGRVTWR